MNCPILPLFLPLITAAMIAAEPATQPLLNLPEGVRTTAQREAGALPIAAIELAVSDGKQIYRLRLAQDGLDKHLVISQDGDVLKVTDYPGINSALADSQKALDATETATKETWAATKESVAKTMASFSSTELTLNQVPLVARVALGNAAAGDRLTDIHATTTGQDTTYKAIVTRTDGTKRPIAVHDDGTVADVR